MIEVRERILSSSDENTNNHQDEWPDITPYELVVDGVVLNDRESKVSYSYVSSAYDPFFDDDSDDFMRRAAFSVEIWGSSACNHVAQRPRIEFGQDIYDIEFNDIWGWLDFTHRITLLFKSVLQGSDTVELWLAFDAQGWKRSWSIAEYRSKIESVTEQNADYQTDFAPEDEFASDDFETPPITFRLTKILKTISPAEMVFSTIEDIANFFRPIHEAAVRALDEEADKVTLSTRFQFPQELSIPCEQYLQYFAQFLRDVGVDVITNLHHEAGNVLFTVTPVDKAVALEKIRAALDSYLSASAVPIEPITHMVPSSIDEMRHQSEILSLHSRLQLAFAAIQVKDATIAAKDAKIEAQSDHIRFLQNAFTPTVSDSPMPQITQQSSETQPDGALFGGRVILKKYDAKAIDINLPMLFQDARTAIPKLHKWAKDLFKHDEPRNGEP